MVPVLYKQDGWMKCVACSDQRRFPGKMWLGYKRNGTDDFVDCPACGGRGEVPHYMILNALTGEEIDYETFGRDGYGNPVPPTDLTPVEPEKR